MAVTYLEKEYDLNGVNYLVEVEVYAKLSSRAFSHEFGIHDPGGFDVEIESVSIITVYDEDGEVVTSRGILQQLENCIDADDFNDEDLDFDE